MKYSDTNKPIQCFQTNSTWYKGAKRNSKPVGILWHEFEPKLRVYGTRTFLLTIYAMILLDLLSTQLLANFNALAEFNPFGAFLLDNIALLIWYKTVISALALSLIGYCVFLQDNLHKYVTLLSGVYSVISTYHILLWIIIIFP